MYTYLIELIIILLYENSNLNVPILLSIFCLHYFVFELELGDILRLIFPKNIENNPKNFL